MSVIIQSWHLLVFAIAGIVNREQQQIIEYLTAENRVLKEQLKKNGRIRFTDKQRRLLAVKAKALGRATLRKIETIVCPDTLLRWYQQLVAQKYDGSGKRGPGRPRIMKEIEALIVRMARENPGWGYTRIRGALWNLRHDVGRTTIANILARHGIEPAPNRRTTWRLFLGSHWDILAATDFFTVEILSPVGLVRYHVLFVIELCTRQVHIAGIVHDPCGEWMEQVARNLTDDFDGFLQGKRYLILDRDPLFTKKFREMLKDAGTKPLRLPARSPNLNAYAERFVLSIKSECLNRMIFFSEGQLRRAIESYVDHYRLERNHQGLGNRLIDGSRPAANEDGEVQCRQRLGGLLKFYHRDAA